MTLFVVSALRNQRVIFNYSSASPEHFFGLFRRNRLLGHHKESKSSSGSCLLLPLVVAVPASKSLRHAHIIMTAQQHLTGVSYISAETLSFNFSK